MSSQRHLHQIGCDALQCPANASGGTWHLISKNLCSRVQQVTLLQLDALAPGAGVERQMPSAKVAEKTLT